MYACNYIQGMYIGQILFFYGLHGVQKCSNIFNMKIFIIGLVDEIHLFILPYLRDVVQIYEIHPFCTISHRTASGSIIYTGILLLSFPNIYFSVQSLPNTQYLH